MRRLRVFLADDHAIVRDGLRAILEREPSVEIVGEAAEGREAVARIVETRPDVAVLDIAMPGLSGLEVARQILAALPETRILVLSMYEDADSVDDLIAGGASGYVLKTEAARELITAIKAVAGGGRYLSRAIAARAGGDLARAGRREPGARLDLTAREREVLHLVAEGYTSAEIARRLGISSKTVETHRGHIATKLGIHNVADLVRYAIRRGVVRP